IVCDPKEPLTEASGLILKYFPERAWQYGLAPNATLNCSYQGILRIEQDPDNYNMNCDRQWKLNDIKIPINQSESFVEQDDGILVICSTENEKIIYKNVHYYIQPKRYLEKRLKYETTSYDLNVQAVATSETEFVSNLL
ncbi:hypothetical protein SK128_001787, partial [Halocaridina rubra]